MNFAVILAAGRGERFGTAIPKQFMMLGGKQVLEHAIDMFYYHPDIDGICVVCPKGYCPELQERFFSSYPGKNFIVTEGGDSRQESTLSGLRSLSATATEDDIILIHDSARPFVSHRIISDNIKLAKEYGAVDTVISSHDTIVESSDGCWVANVPDRRKLLIGQTPQSFRYGLVYGVLRESRTEELARATDDVTLVMKAGYPVHLVEGEKTNFKITTAWDLQLAEAVLERLKQ